MIYPRGFLCAIVLNAILCSVWAVHDKIVVLIPAEMVLTLRREAKFCAEKSGVDPDSLKKVIDWSIDNDEPSKEFIFCLCERTGFSHNDGHLQMDKMLAHKLGNGTREDYVKAVTDCNKITRGNPQDTLYDIGTCFYENAIIKVV